MSVQRGWRDQAVCAGLGSRVADAVFFPQQSYARAKVLCGGCPVRGECLVDALERERDGDLAHLHGMFGGFTPAERGAVLRAEREVAA